MAVFFTPIERAFDAFGNPVNGAKLYTRLSGTTTPVATFTDAALTAPHTNPIVADTVGVFPAIYLTADVNYRFILTDGSDPGNDPDLETDLWQNPFDDYRTQSEDSYDYTVGGSEAVATNQRFLGPNAVREHFFTDDFAGSLGTLETAPTAETVFSIQVNQITVGSLTFASASQSGVFSTIGVGIETVLIGDQVDILAPATVNAAVGLRVTFKGNYIRS